MTEDERNMDLTIAELEQENRTLKAKYDTLLSEYEAMANQAIFNNDFKNRLATAIGAMPFGDTAASFAVYIREFK